MINWTRISKKDTLAISHICKRAKRTHPEIDLMSLNMDIGAAHLDCKIKLTELLDAQDGDFFHDVWGIQGHIDRETGKLTDCFLPRYAH